LDGFGRDFSIMTLSRRILTSAFVLTLGLGVVCAGQVRASEPAKEPVPVPVQAPAAAPAAASANPAPAASGVNWMERCQDVKKNETETFKYCEVFQRLSMKAKDSDKMQRVSEFAVGYPNGLKEKAHGVLIVPLGILLDDPVELDLDGKKQFTSRVSYCQPDGCYAQLVLSDGALEKIGKAKAMTVKLKALNGQTVQFNLLPEGFREAIEKIQKG
jgi:invasion protein IalB